MGGFGFGGLCLGGLRVHWTLCFWDAVVSVLVFGGGLRLGGWFDCGGCGGLVGGSSCVWWFGCPVDLRLGIFLLF